MRSFYYGYPHKDNKKKALPKNPWLEKTRAVWGDPPKRTARLASVLSAPTGPVRPVAIMRYIEETLAAKNSLPFRQIYRGATTADQKLIDKFADRLDTRELLDEIG